jgi:hypothetical protein
MMSAPRPQSFYGQFATKEAAERAQGAVQGKYSTAPAGTAGGNGFGCLIPGLEGEQLHHRDRPARRWWSRSSLTLPLGLKLIDAMICEVQTR